MYRGDLARDGHPAGATLDAAGASRLAPVWTAHLDGAIDGTPAIGAGLVIAGSAGGSLAAFDAGSGREVWARHGVGAISSSPTIAGDRVYVTTLTGHGYAFGLTRGDLLWDWTGPPSSALWASPVAYRDEVIVGVASPYGDSPLVAGRLYGLDAARGTVRWSTCIRAGCAAGGGVWSTPSIDRDGHAFVGTGNPDDAVIAFDAMTGRRTWAASNYADQGRDLDLGASPVVLTLNGDAVIAQAMVQGSIATFNATTGAVVWWHQLVAGSAVHGLLASPAFDGGRLYVASASPPTGIFAVGASAGEIVWRHDTALAVYSAPAAGNGVIVFGTGNVFGDLNQGSLVALSTVDGRALWTYDTHSAVRSGPALAGDLVVAGDYAGDLLAFRPRS
jgi:outer membrane protein assembly factor BamB